MKRKDLAPTSSSRMTDQSLRSEYDVSKGERIVAEKPSSEQIIFPSSAAWTGMPFSAITSSSPSKVAVFDVARGIQISPMSKLLSTRAIPPMWSSWGCVAMT